MPNKFLATAISLPLFTLPLHAVIVENKFRDNPIFVFTSDSNKNYSTYLIQQNSKKNIGDEKLDFFSEKFNGGKSAQEEFAENWIS